LAPGGGNSGCSAGPEGNGFIRTDGTFSLGGVTDNAYWRIRYFVEDAAGNRTVQDTITTLIDTAAPTAGAVQSPSILTGNASASFSSTVADNVELGDAQPVINYGAFMTLEEARTQIMAYGPPANAGSQTATATVTNFIRSIEDYSAGPGTPVRANLVGFLLRDVAGVVDNAACPAVADAATQTATASGTVLGTATTPWPARTPAPNGNCFIRTDDITTAVNAGIPTSATSASRERSLSFTGLTSFTVASSNPTVCSDRTTAIPGAGGTAPGCATGSQTATVLTASATGPTATFANPFARVNFYYQDPVSTRWVLIGTSTAASVTDNAGNRTFMWTMPWNPANFVAGAYPVRAVGVHTTGMAAATGSITQTITDD
jgi:hypothetical protein